MAQHDTPAHSGKAIAILRVDPYEHGGIVVTSSAVDAEGRLDPVHSAAGDNTSPPLQWSGVLEAQSYVLIVQDPDAPRDEPVTHWVVWDIPGAATELAQDVGTAVHPDGLREATQGLNSHGRPGWTGMAPPQGGGVHRYHFQLFAVNRRLGLRPDASLEHLVEALKGNTIAKGELVGLFETPDLPAGR
jgi:Raf kinase inhibitor-like YbhB/YbcL family protein